MNESFTIGILGIVVLVGVLWELFPKRRTYHDIRAPPVTPQRRNEDGLDGDFNENSQIDPAFPVNPNNRR